MNDESPSLPVLDASAPDFEVLLGDLFLRLMDVPGDRVDAEVIEAQRRFCLALKIDRSVLWQVDPQIPDRLLATHVFGRRYDTSGEDTGVLAIRAPTGGTPLSHDTFPPKAVESASYPWISRRVFAGLTTAVADLDDLPAEAAADAAMLRSAGTISTVVVPLQVGGAVVGGLSFAATRQPRRWPPELVKRFELVAQVFAKALAKKHTEARLQGALADLQRLRDRLQHENVSLRQEIREQRGPQQTVGTSAAIRRVLALVDQVAPTTSTVLLCGETGTGKERIATAIHELSLRRDRAMVRVNCSAMPASLIESELFGREKGAYTGALTRQVGRFELADGSTIFLDEIGDLPIETQTKLLRVIESREFERLGSPKSVHVDVRIIAATNQDLERAVREKRFREDLYFRLNVFPITLPPLRDRLEDIPILVKAIVDQLNVSMGRQFDTISRASLESLQRYTWPGNIRELRNIVERAMITGSGPVLHIEPPEQVPRTAGAPPTLRDIERDHVLSVLQETGWRIRGPRGAAAILGLPPTTLENRMARLGIVRPGR